MAYAPEDIVNMALDVIGYPRHIADIYEGSAAAIVALEIYAQTRDQLLAKGEWPFALREVTLAAVAGQVPPSPWQNEYQYPSDCLRIRYIRPGPLTGGTRSNDPQPVLFRPWNDQRPAAPVLAILCDLPAPVLIYQGRITDPGTWVPGFTEAFIDELATKLAFGLSRSEAVVKARVALSDQTTQEAMAVDDMAPPMGGAPVAAPSQR